MFKNENIFLSEPEGLNNEKQAKTLTRHKSCDFEQNYLKKFNRRTDFGIEKPISSKIKLKNICSEDFMEFEEISKDIQIKLNQKK